MHKRYKILILVFLCSIMAFTSKAQYDISSPYSQYGIGSTNLLGNQYNSSMGGISQAIRRNNVINLLNPASYTAIDTQSFVFDIGFSMMWKNVSTTDYSSKSFLASITNISMAFPLCKSLKVALALTPLSDISYSASDTILAHGSFGDDDYIPTRVQSFDGNGGLDKLTFGLAYQPTFNRFLSRFSIGVNASYIFGNIYRSSLLSFGGAEGYVNSRVEKNYNVSAFSFDIGMQYFQPLKNGDILCVGATVGLPNKYSADEEYFRYTYINEDAAATLQDTIQYLSNDRKITMPYSLSAGLSYSRTNKFLVGVDAVYTKWSDFGFENNNIAELKDNLKLSMGGEFIPNLYGTYFEQFSYRAGINYDNGYIYLKDKRISKLGLSVGLSLPVKKLGTNINLSFEYGKLGTTDNGLIKESYYSLGLSITAKDRWFVKRKYR